MHELTFSSSDSSMGTTVKQDEELQDVGQSITMTEQHRVSVASNGPIMPVDHVKNWTSSTYSGPHEVAMREMLSSIKKAVSDKIVSKIVYDVLMILLAMSILYCNKPSPSRNMPKWIVDL